MKRAFVFLALFLALTVASFGQALPNAPSSSRTIDKAFVAVSVFVAGTAVADVETTRVVLDNGGTEQSLVLGQRPSPTHLYAWTAFTTSASLYTAWRLKRAHKSYWWVIPVAVGASHVVGAVWNHNQYHN